MAFSLIILKAFLAFTVPEWLDQNEKDLSLWKQYFFLGSFARRALEKALNRFPSLSKSTFSAVMAAISKGTHGEEGAEGASEALGMKPLIRHYTQVLSFSFLGFRSLNPQKFGDNLICHL